MLVKISTIVTNSGLIQEQKRREVKIVQGERGLMGEEVLQLRHLEFEKCEKEWEVWLWLKELELKEKKLSLQVKLKELEVRSKDYPNAVGAAFDVSKYVKFLPDFQETMFNKYFLNFEKVASNLNWLKDKWVLLLGSLVSKTRKVYSFLPIEESSQYSVVKTVILEI